MAWSTSDRRAELPGDWSQRKAKRKKIDGDRCTAKLSDGRRCTRTEELEVDHHDQARSWDHSIENLRTLCSWHHGKKSSAEGNAAYWRNMRMQGRKFRRTEDHPAYR